MDRLRFAYLPSMFLCLILLLGCSQPKDVKIKSSEAYKKFQSSLKSEQNLDVITNWVDNTLWIYYAGEDELLGYQSCAKIPHKTSKSSINITLKFIDVNYKDGRFDVQYDISERKGYDIEPGYIATYKEAYQKVQGKIISALQQSFFSADNPPKFIVIVIADIKNGIEIESLQHFNDLKGAMSMAPTIPQEEYARRYITEVRGNKAIVDDKVGRHIDFSNITMPQFLAKQMTYRVNFKYTQSSFPPSADTEMELLKIIADTLRAYNFTDFSEIKLSNLENNTEDHIPQDEFMLYAEDVGEDSGRFVEINFR